MRKELQAMLHDNTCTDTVLILSTGYETRVHKIVIASSSPVFRAVLDVNIDEVQLITFCL